MTIEITNPWTGQVDYRYDYQDQAAVEQTLTKSRAAFGPWSSLSLEQRSGYMERVAGQLREHRERIAGIMSAEMGKVMPTAVSTTRYISQ